VDGELGGGLPKGEGSEVSLSSCNVGRAAIGVTFVGGNIV